MKRLALAILMLAIEPALSAPAQLTTDQTLSIQNYSCAYATVMADDTVIIDWKCVQLQAMGYKQSRGRDPNATFAFVLESLRNGTAIAK